MWYNLQRKQRSADRVWHHKPPFGRPTEKIRGVRLWFYKGVPYHEWELNKDFLVEREEDNLKKAKWMTNQISKAMIASKQPAWRRGRKIAFRCAPLKHRTWVGGVTGSTTVSKTVSLCSNRSRPANSKSYRSAIIEVSNVCHCHR